MQRISSLFAFAVLTACGGAGNPITFDRATPFGPVSQSEVDTLSQSWTTMRDDVLAISETAEAAVPTVGRATFNGKVSLAVTPSDADDAMMLYGDSVLVADFAEPLVTAQMDNFTGEADEGTMVRMSGELTMEDGRIGFGARNSINGTFRGSLTGTNIALTTNGALSGVFRDTPIAAVSFDGIDTAATHNGQTATVALSGVATE